jgi:hypothetical protein
MFLISVDGVEMSELGLDPVVLVNGVETERELPLEVMEDAEREGPSLDATRADLSKKRLYSYLAAAKGQTADGSRMHEATTHIECIAPTRCLSLSP